MADSQLESVGSAGAGPSPARKRINDLTILAIILVVGLANSLVYLLLVPPWQHYDEPSHFEVAWLAAHLGKIPQTGDFDSQLGRVVIESMYANHFYGDAPTPVFQTGQEVRIPGYSQLDEPPAYYLLASLPLRLARSAGIEVQLRAARAVSLLLFLLTILVAWGIACELTRPGHPLRWMVPLSLALLPGLTDLMTAVNNDVGAVAFVSFFLWGSVRLIRRGYSILDLLWVLASAGLCLFTKSTAFYALILLPLALILPLARGRLRWLTWGVLAAGVVAAILASLGWGDAALWGRSTLQAEPTRVKSPQAPLGEHAFQIEVLPGITSELDFQLHQLLDLPANSLQGKQITMGAWIWASSPNQASTPVFNTFNGSQGLRQVVAINETPVFFAFTAQIPGDAQRNWLTLSPLVNKLEAPVTFYYDGLVVLEGSWPLDQPPSFDNSDGRTGEWGGERFTNLVRNPSAESAWLRLKPWVDRIGRRVLPDPGVNTPSVTMYYFLDWAGSRLIQANAISHLFRTYWARFGWGHVPLLQGWSYWIVLAFTVVGVIGAVVAVWRLRRKIPWNVAVFLGFALLGTWTMTIGRGSNYPVHLRPIYFPTARYAYPVVLPSMLLLNLGWYETSRSLVRRLRLPRRVASALYIIALVAFDLYAILSIASYYYGG